MTFRNGLDSLLRPEDSVLVLIDHQPYQLANLNSHDPQAVVNNSTALAKLAKAFNVPTILTSVIADRGGKLFKQITDVFPGQEVIDRTWVNTWEDEKVVDLVHLTPLIFTHIFELTVRVGGHRRDASACVRIDRLAITAVRRMTPRNT